ncbi:MAG: enoyl-CoA hydratase/isomerase family protein [Actinobacteria bacterium]|nr:MAG: enoyl-CoA hydratase/isomerase family protein [Actinomycetota bacterium]
MTTTAAPSSEELVVRSDSDGLATLTLNRPDKLNALTPGSFVALREHLEAIALDDSIRCVVLQGAGRSFCAGHDLGSIASGERAPSKDFEPETVDALEQLPQPTIARIHGHCFTGGLELALACDILIAAESTKLGDTHGQWGLVPIWGMSVRLPERVGRSTAKEMMFTSRRINGTEAAAIGLVDRAVPDDQLDATVSELANEILTNSYGTNSRVKKLIAAQSDMSRTDALLHERSLPFGLPEDMQDRMSAG